LAASIASISIRKRGENIRRAALGGGVGGDLGADPGSVRAGRIFGSFTSGQPQLSRARSFSVASES
jgi:hypothetical protein